MGKVTCGRHGSVCCWRCDHCPKCEGTFSRVGKGDYCPDCTKWLKANGYVFSTYRMDYVKAEDLPADLKAAADFKILEADFTCCGVHHSSAFDACTGCKKTLPLSKRAAPRTEQTEAGIQTVIDETPARSVPDKKLSTERKQSEAPLALELPAIEAQQMKLF